MAEAERVSKPGSIVECARAKINLTLSVVGRRSDGYHELRSLVVFADIGDTVTLTLGAPPEVSVTGPFSADIAGRNLVAETLTRLAQAEPRFELGAVTIEKNLPVAAGLGGGSADAAAALRAIRRANPAISDTFDWIGFAAGLGSDVPVCLVNQPSLMWGREKSYPWRASRRLLPFWRTPECLFRQTKPRKCSGAFRLPRYPRYHPIPSRRRSSLGLRMSSPMSEHT